ncbi:MAG: AtpZ/AtpI family protein [Patescibacteria group bacterium]
MKNESWALALKVMAKLSGWIAFPVIIATFLGKWLDKKFGSEPWLFLGTVGLAFIVSMYGLIINALQEFKKIDAEYAKNKKEEENNKDSNNLSKK